MLTKNPLSDLPSAVPVAGDLVVGLQKQQDGSFKNVLFAAANSAQVLAKFVGANLNTLADQIINLLNGNQFAITEIMIANPSININAAQDAQFWSGPNRTGYKIAFSTVEGGIDSALSKLVNPSNYVNSELLFLSLNVTDKPEVIANKIYFSLGVAQGAPATADIYVMGFPLQ